MALSPGGLPTPVSSSRFLKRKVHRGANSSSITEAILSGLDQDDCSEDGYSGDSGSSSQVSQNTRRLDKSISENIPRTLPLGSPADVVVPAINGNAPESTGTTIARKSKTVQLLQPDGGIPPPPQPPIPDPTGSYSTDRPSPLMASALRYGIFLTDAPKPTVLSPTPIHPRAPIESTLQLVFCAKLLLEDQNRSTSQCNPTEVYVLDDAGRLWFDAIQEDPSAQARIRWLVSRLVKEFLKDPSLGPEAIFEVVVLGPVLCEVDYRALLSCFIERFDRSALLNVDLLQGMIQLLQSATPGFLNADDLVRIVSSLRKRLESTHAPDKAHVYNLVFAVSKVLEVMVKGEVKGLNRQQDHQSLLTALRNLKGVDDDEFLKFQISYAYQMSLYLPDDETSFQSFWRYAESVAVGASAVASVFKLDPMSALAAVEHIQQVAGNTIDVVKFNIDGARAFQATAEGATQAAENAYWSQKRQPWFLVLQAGYLFVRDGRLVDFNRLVCDATCRDDVNFQRGVCQILGEIALNPLWDDGSRRNAIDFLREFCKTDGGKCKDIKIRTWVAVILRQISSSVSPDVSGHARTLLDNLQQEHALDVEGCRALNTPLPIPAVFPLLERALDITDVDHELACIRFRSLEECSHPVSIPLRAKATLQAPEDQSFPLKEKVLEFLQSDKLVFLLLGDSGSGKSTFCRQLERELWKQHQRNNGSRVPLYISLPSIDDPHCGLIEKYLQHHHNILEPVIQNIKNRRQFVLICDGYDESRLIQNLYTSNRLNRPGQWNVKMIVTCRSTFLGPGYQCRFYPLENDKYHDKSSGLFEESTIVPFRRSDIQEFVKQYVLDFAAQKPSDNPSAPSFDDYWEKLSVIPNLMNLVSNPFLLTLALKAIPSRSIEAIDSTGLEVMQLDLYDNFIQDWVDLHQKRVEGTILKHDTRTAFDNLLRDGFAWCVTDYLKRLADAIYQYQDGRPVVKFSRRHMEDWKVEFFGPEIETTLLRDASPLTRAGIRHWFIHKSLLDYFYHLTFFDPDDSDDDDSDNGDDGNDDSRGGGDDFHSGGGNSLGGGGDGLADDNGDSADGNGGSTGNNTESTGNDGGSSNGNGDSFGGNGGSTNGSQISSGSGSGNPSGGNNNNGSHGDKNGSNEDEDGSRRRKDDARFKRKGNTTKSRPSTSSDPFSKRNLFKEPSVLQFLVERAESDPRLKKRLFSAIEQAKASSVPSMAAANAITILFKSKNLCEDAVLDGVFIPSDYISAATGSTEPVQLTKSSLTGGDLMQVLVALSTPESESTATATVLTVLASTPAVPASMPFSASIAQETSTTSLEYYRSNDKNGPPLMPPKSKWPPLSTLGLNANSALSLTSTLPSEDNQSTPPRTTQEKARVSLTYTQPLIQDKRLAKFKRGFISHGIREPLTTRIAGILKAYPDSTQIARELLQNSDDAGSTVQWYLLDHRDHVKHARRSAGSNLDSDPSKDTSLRLFHEDLEEYMGPALLSGSDSVFEEMDFQSLKNLASSVKRADESKIGQMGIGFNSIYHLTDCPSFISGDQLMIIEPHERIFNGERSHLSEGAVRGSFLNPSQGLHEYPDQLKTFSVLEDIDFSKPYKGTIFRFPLRTPEQAKTSSLTKYPRTPEEVLEMLNELKNEALKALLFLKHVQKIVIYERREDQDKPTKLFEIEIVNSAEVAAQRSQLIDNFKRHVRLGDSIDEAEVLECSTRPIYKMTHEDGRTTEETWQVTTRIGNIGKTRASMLEASHGDVNIADHKLIPWVGIAAPSDPDFKMDSSGLFCFLPVGDIQLPFPVHINGHFAVEQSRRDIWTNTEKKIKTQSSAGIESLWNVHLFDKQIPEAYALFLENIGLDHGANYELWPTYCGDGVGRDAVWKDMLKSTLRAALSSDRPVFFCGPKPDGNIHVEPYSKIYIAGRDIDAFPLLKKALRIVVDLAEDVPDVILAELPDAVESLELTFRTLTPALVMSILHDTKKQWSLTADAATRVEMVKYCLQDDKSASLVGLPLLPLAGGSWVEFSREQANQRFRVSSDVFRTLGVSNDGLVDLNVEGYPLDDIEQGCCSGTGMYWSTMRPSSVAGRIKSVYHKSFYRDGVVPKERVAQYLEQFPSDKWLTDFWNMVNSFPNAVDQNELLSELEGIHLIPILGNFLAPLSKDHSVLYRDPDTANKDMQVSQTALVILNEHFDCHVLRKLPMSSLSPLQRYLVDVSVGPRVLGLLSNVNRSCFEQPTPTDCENLRQYLTICLSPRASLDSQQRQVLRHLPVFESYQETRLVPLDTPSSSMQWSVAQGYCHSSQPWIPSSVNLLAEDQPMKHHIRYLLEIPFLTKAEFLRLLVSELKERPESEWDPILSELFLGYYEHQKKVDFAPLLRPLPFVQVKTSTSEMASSIRIKPRFVADPALSMFFMDDEAVFPSGIYAKPAFRGPLEELGMKLAFNSTFVEERMSSLFSATSSGQGDTHKKASLALYDRLNSMFSEEFITKDILSMMSSLPWLYAGKSEQCRPSDCRPKEDGCLVGSQMSISEFSPSNALLREHMGWTTPPPLEKVLAHFSSLLDQASITGGSTIQLANQDVSSIYKYLALKVQNPVSLAAIEKVLSNRPWILVSGTLYTVDRVAFKLDNILRPQFAQVASSSLDDLFRALGVRESISQRDIEAILATIRSNYDNSERLSNKDADLVRRLLTALAHMKSIRLTSDLPVLTKGGYLKRAADVVYDDRASRRGGSDDDQLPYTFLDDGIPKTVAQCLQIDMFSVRAWEECKDTTFEPFFQQEDIVDRIKGILNDYDPSGIFIEYLQNASDAGATKFSVMLDTRTYDKAKVLSERMAAWQGPALLFYNDVKFSEENFSALCKLGVGNKREDTSKVGRHGLGFNSAYHFTDVPSLVSGDSLVIFDPHMANLPRSRDNYGKLIAQRGHRYDIRKLTTETLVDQFQPYKGVFGFDMESHFNGTIFRIPLRLKGAPMVGKTGFGGEDWTPSQIQRMFISWIEDAKVGMLFLRNIKSIELSDGTSPMVSVTKHDCSNEPAVQFLTASLPSHASQVSIVDITSTSTGLGNITNAVSSRWLVHTEDALPANTPQDIRSLVQTQHWSTQSGVAIPLGDDRAIKSCRGRLMVHLPTPIETKLPFHMHGGFALTTNRKTLAGGSEAGDPKTVWNTYLLDTCLPLTALQAYRQLLTWSFRPAPLGGPQVRELSTAIPHFYKRWPLKANDGFATFLSAFFQHAYTSPVFPCRGHPSELPIEAVAGKNTILRGHIISESVETRVFSWLRETGRSIAETPTDLQTCLMREWGHDASRPFKQIDCNLLRRRLRQDPDFIPRQMKSLKDKQWILEEIFRPMDNRSIVAEESLLGLCVVPLLSGEWKPLRPSPIYYIATAEARELVEGKELLVNSDLFDSAVLQRVKNALVKDPAYGIEEIRLGTFASIFLSENPHGVSEDKLEKVWAYLNKFDDITPAYELPIVKTTTGDMVTVAKAAEGLEISTAFLQDKPIRIMTEFFRRMGVTMFDASQHQSHLYLRRLQVDYSERRVLGLIAKNWSTHASSFVISAEEAGFLREMISSQHRYCNASVLSTLGGLPIWRTYGPPGTPLRSAIGFLYMTDHESLENLGHHPTILHEVGSMIPFDRMGATSIQAASILRERIMPKFASNELQCTGATKSAYLALCRSLMATASYSSMRENTLAKQVLNHAQCFLSRDGSFQTLAHMFVPGEDLTETIFVNEQHRFPDSDLYTIIDGRFSHNIRRLMIGAVEDCAKFVLNEIANGSAAADQILSRATHLVRYIYGNPGSTNWMDPKWTFVPREMTPEYPYNQHAPDLPHYMSFSTLCYPTERDYLWTQRGFFPQDLVPSARFRQQFSNIGRHTWREYCQHLEVLVKNIAPTMSTTERQLTFKATIFKIYKAFEDRGSEKPTASDIIKQSLREIMTVPYILNGDDKDPTKAESWVWPHDLVFGIDHKIGAHQQAHRSLLKFRNFLVSVGANEMKHIAGQVTVRSKRNIGELENRITTYFETQDEKNGFMDVKFVFEGGKSILAHKVVLASINEEVIRQLTGSWALSARRDPFNPAIDIIQKGDDYITFWGLLYFLYTDELIGTNGPPTLSAAIKPFKEQDAEDQLSERVEYLVDLQHLADVYRTDRLKGLIAQELMLPGKVMYSNVFDIREHAELNRDPSVVKYCNQFIEVKENASLIEKYLEDEVVSVQAKLVALDQYLGDENAQDVTEEVDQGGAEEVAAREALRIELEDLEGYLSELKMKR